MTRHRSAGVLAAIALAGTALSCRPSRPCPAVPSTTAQPSPRRDRCLAPPWVVDPARPEAGVAGWSAAVCTDAADSARRNAYFIHDGSRVISESELRKVQQAVTAATGNPSGTGVCCSPRVARETKVVCLQIWVEICSQSMSQTVQTVDEALKSHGLADVRFGVAVTITGLVGPRCETPGAAACGPISSRDAAAYRAGCAAGRVRLAPADQATRGGACVHDGECELGNCGAECLRWDQLPAHVGCNDSRDLDDEDTPVRYCGCVSGRCDWFRVAP